MTNSLTIFNEDAVEMRDKNKGGAKILKGSLDGKIYRLHIAILSPKAQALVVIDASKQGSTVDSYGINNSATSTLDPPNTQFRRGWWTALV